VRVDAPYAYKRKPNASSSSPYPPPPPSSLSADKLVFRLMSTEELGKIVVGGGGGAGGEGAAEAEAAAAAGASSHFSAYTSAAAEARDALRGAAAGVAGPHTLMRTAAYLKLMFDIPQRMFNVRSHVPERPHT
jgi:hypothetical protein